MAEIRFTGKVDIRQFIARYDKLFNAEKTEEAGNFLRSYLQYARSVNDKTGELAVLSEMMGHYRMSGDKTRGMEAVKDGYVLLESLNINPVDAATIRLNGATALQAFGEIKSALENYSEVLSQYNIHLEKNDPRHAGLRNNMAAAYAADGNFENALTLYLDALDILKNQDNLCDSAVTYVNLAMLYRRLSPDAEMEMIMFDSAMELLEKQSGTPDAYFAHTCRKCAGAFLACGRKDNADKLNKFADDFYAGN